MGNLNFLAVIMQRDKERMRFHFASIGANCQNMGVEISGHIARD